MDRFEKTIQEVLVKYSNDIKIILEKSKGKQIVIFGAGELGHRFYNILKTWKIPVKCFCDNKINGRIDRRTGMKIVSLNELKGEVNKLFIPIAVFDELGYSSVYQQLLDFGVESSELMDTKVITERLTITYLEENLEKYRKAYSLLEDDFSKEVYLNRIKKAYLDIDISEIVSEAQEEYFDENILLTDEEVFVDCGVYDGDTAVEFINRTGGRFKKIIIFEPEKSKADLIRERMKDYSYDFYKYGVWSQNTVLKFNARGDMASRVSEDGDVEIEVRTLDDIIIDDAPTYIKMDIEGSEIEALRGGRKTIRQHKPKLAICIYHNPQDLFEIPIMIKEMCADYKIYIRQYADSIYETVCYAV